MRTLLLAVMLVGSAAAAQGADIISDRGEGYARSTSTLSAPVAPGERDRAAAEAALARDLEPLPRPPAPTPLAPPPEESVLEDAQNAPGTGLLLRGRGGHDHVERRGGALILDGEGRRLEILPVKNRFLETPPLRKPPSDLEGVLGRLRALTGAGAVGTLLLTAWLWRRKGA